MLAYFDPLRQLIENGIKEGYINPLNGRLITFVNGPDVLNEHENFDWGNAAINAIETWEGVKAKNSYNWDARKDGYLGAT